MTELFLVARVAGRGVAIATAQVSSVVDIADLVAVPGAPSSVRGLAALRSRVVTVVDTAIALGLPEGDEHGTRAVITRVDGHEYALLVDELADVAAFERLPLSAGMALSDGWGVAGVGLVERDGEPLLILDVATLVPGMATAA
jgi:purine-binding chemotaxis protein CheW